MDQPSHSSRSQPHHHHHKPPRNYKLLVDPFLQKGTNKVYRYDGIVPNDPNAPPTIVRDPRSILSRRWVRIEPLEIPVPKFKVRVGHFQLSLLSNHLFTWLLLNCLCLQIDGNYVGDPPALEVTISNLNDNIDKAFLSDMVSVRIGRRQNHSYPVSRICLLFI